MQDAAPSVYVYSEEFEVPGTHTRKVRTGFIALARVEDYDAKVVFRHERTLSGPKADRIELLRQHAGADRAAYFSCTTTRPGASIHGWKKRCARAFRSKLVDEYRRDASAVAVADPRVDRCDPTGDERQKAGDRRRAPSL